MNEKTNDNRNPCPQQLLRRTHGEDLQLLHRKRRRPVTGNSRGSAPETISLSVASRKRCSQLLDRSRFDKAKNRRRVRCVKSSRRMALSDRFLRPKRALELDLSLGIVARSRSACRLSNSGAKNPQILISHRTLSDALIKLDGVPQGLPFLLQATGDARA